MRRIGIAAIGVLGFAAPAMSATNLLTNGSFETGDLTGWIADPQGAGNTTIAVYSGGYCCQGATPPDGNYAVAFGGGGAGAGEIAQAFATVPGLIYSGSVQYAGVGVPDSVVQVRAANVSPLTLLYSQTVTPSFDGNWQTLNFSFEATSTLSALDIYGPSDGGCCSDTNVDNAIITVPEPATLGLAGIGALGLLARRRRA